MDSTRAILAVALCFLVFIIWSFYFTPKPQKPAPPAKPEVAPARPEAAITPPPAVLPEAKPDLSRPPRRIEVRNGVLNLVFTEEGARLVSCQLVKFREKLQADSPPKELVKIGETSLAPLGLTLVQGKIVGLEEARFEALTGEDLLSAKDQEVSLAFRFVYPQGVEVIKRFLIRPESYLIGLEVELHNRSGQEIDDNLGLILNARHEPHEGGRGGGFKGFGGYVSGKLHQEEVKKLKEPKVFFGKVSWGGYENTYFLQAIVPEDKEGGLRASLLDATKDNELVSVRYVSPPFALGPGQSGLFKFNLFFGPKEIGLLKSLGHDLETSINMGWFDIVAKPFLYFLKFIYGYLHNYGLAIIVLTVLIKIAFWPLTQKSFKSMQAMQKLQPLMAKLREKYKDDRQRLNQEMMNLYRSHKINPMGGCLPMLVQLPVFYALYRLLSDAIELRHAPFWLWINDLSAPDRLFSFDVRVPMMEPPYGIPVLTLLMGVSMFIQQKMTPTVGDPAQAKIMLMMPVIFTFVFINFPSGLVLYWLVNNLLSIGQQALINRSQRA